MKSKNFGEVQRNRDMTRAFITSVFLGSLSILATPAIAQSQVMPSFTQYSTTSSTVVKGQTVKTKIARSGNKIRFEETSGSAGAQYTLFLIDQDKNYAVLSPSTCLEFSHISNMTSGPLTKWPAGKANVTKLGTATVNGHPTEIEQITIAPDNGDKPETMKVWAATDLHGFPVRTEEQTPQGPVVTDYSDVSLSAPADSLFTVPQNCQKVPTAANGQN